MSVWTKVVDRLAVSTNVAKLKRKIICDVGDVVAARLVVEPLKRIGLTPDAIRIGSTPYIGLEDVASRAVLGPTRTKGLSFRFLDLPTEMRQYILSLTDLVTPVGQIYCLGGVKFQRVERWNDRSRCRTREYCDIYYAVYPHCDCWLPPTSLFLVCRDMLHDARGIFFASNRFIVRPRSSQQGMDKPFEASIFLRKVIPREALSHLRSLEIIFPAILYDFFERDEGDFSGFDRGIYHDWLLTIECIAPRLKTLELRLRMGYGRLRIADPSWDVDEIPGWQKALFLTHEHIVRPLRKLQCLNNFFVHATSPYGRDVIDSQQLRDHELRLETLVMGARYDSIARGEIETRRK